MLVAVAATIQFAGNKSARAAPFFTVTGGSAFLEADDDFLWIGPRNAQNQVLLWEGATVGISEPGFITLEYIGKEALFDNNIFRWNGVDIFDTGPGNPLIVGQTAATPFPPPALETYVVPGIVPAGALPFSFFISQFSKEIPNDSSTLDIGLWPVPENLGDGPFNFGTVLYVMLDDESVVDSDHDDMIVRITVTPVPEPGTLALCGLAAVPLVCRLARRRTATRPAPR
jgi:hypothetical protein